MSTKIDAFSKAVDRYMDYIHKPWGQLFYKSAWNQIQDHLPDYERSILDIGCGFGLTSIEFARLGCKVTGIEPTLNMLQIAQENAASEGLKIIFMNSTFPAAVSVDPPYDCIFCHNVLEYVEDPHEVLQSISELQNAEGILSLISHNPAAKLMKKAIVNKDPEDALASIGNKQEYSGIIQTDYTLYSYEQLVEWLDACGYDVRCTYGIHNLYGYIADNERKMDEAWHEQMMKLELEISRMHPYKDIAIFTHLIAVKRG
ncbi:class I SAM-dependent methyltransferase [Paenibacillus marinisediminis]